ncbi:Predicted RNA-binding protein, contains TRAM domain [Halorubrum ezzemoulense]|uniref:Predicted RNA-binding protein, contains TRAM domain n=1 Tax=Halorubrum ezzemoulense TaxID=337243 RepID=A0A238YSJ1_HALEZ|nr:TRAM domain-containing protein [Halorubrum ezzemoulense]SNR73644.1 Predicted RNA-binding protein, contains TRAM domain [Halorubrum ezzemoulense]
MDISETLQTLYTATVEQDDGAYQITVPDREIATGTLSEGETYRVALISTSTPDTEAADTTEDTQSPDHAGQQHEYDGLPVEEGEQRDVEIENLGDQGDGIAKVEHGYVVIVPETNIGDRVTVEMQQVRENVAFADVVDDTPRGEV